MRTITIKPALNGYICTVGCQTVVFMTPRQLCDELEAYLRDPSGTEARAIKNALNPMENQPPQAATTPNLSEELDKYSRELATVPDRPQTMRERALAGTLPAGTPPIHTSAGTTCEP